MTDSAPAPSFALEQNAIDRYSDLIILGRTDPEAAISAAEAMAAEEYPTAVGLALSYLIFFHSNERAVNLAVEFLLRLKHEYGFVLIELLGTLTAFAQKEPLRRVEFVRCFLSLIDGWDSDLEIVENIYWHGWLLVHGKKSTDFSFEERELTLNNPELINRCLLETFVAGNNGEVV